MSTLKVNNREHVDHSRDEARQEARKTRIPVAGPRNILNVDEQNRDPSKHYCWVNDDDKGSVQRFLDGGYEFALSNVSVGETTIERPSTSSDSVVSKNVGHGMVAYLMAVPIEYYNEDMEAEQRQIDEMEREMYRGFEGSYNPNAKVGGAALKVDNEAKNK